MKKIYTGDFIDEFYFKEKQTKAKTKTKRKQILVKR